jgi:D,D-heptose 1,7-bisphosphate phosphatase
MKQAVILAGGKGTRLREVLGDVPKPLAEICGGTLLGHQLRLLREHGFSDVVVLVNHGAQAISNWLSARPDPGLVVRLIDDDEPRGTAGAVLSAYDHLAPEFAVLYADTMLGVDLTRFWNWHATDPGAAASLFLHPNDHPADSDLVEIDARSRILRFHPYPRAADQWLPNLVNAALYIVRRDSLLPWRNSPEQLDFGEHLFPRMLKAGLALRGYNCPEYIKDAGTPARLEKVRKDFASGAVARASLSNPQKAVFIDRDGTLNAEAGYIARAEDLRVLPSVGPALRRLNESEWRAVIITNQPVLARGEASELDMRRIHARLDTEVARSHAYFDALYICPHHPDSGFAGEVAELKRVCSCRKPEPGLIFDAARDLHIDLAESWLIGDTTADLGAAERAGVSSILVQTGSKGRDGKYPYEPSFVQPDFAGAVQFILEGYEKIAELWRPVVNRVAIGQDVLVTGSDSVRLTVATTLARELRRRGRKCLVANSNSKTINAQLAAKNDEDGPSLIWHGSATADTTRRFSGREKPLFVDVDVGAPLKIIA